MKYNVEIRETLSRTFQIEAASEDEAYEKVKNKYMQEEIVLDFDDYVDTDFIVNPIAASTKALLRNRQVVERRDDMD